MRPDDLDREATLEAARRQLTEQALHWWLGQHPEHLARVRYEGRGDGAEPALVLDDETKEAFLAWMRVRTPAQVATLIGFWEAWP